MDSVTDDPRGHAQRRLEQMVGRGELTLAEFSDRAARIWAATCPADLEAALSGLPGDPSPSPRPVGSVSIDHGSGRQWAILGDLRRTGRWNLTEGFAATTVLGTIFLDCREAVVDAPQTRIDILSFGGTAKVLLPPGVSVRISGTRLLGNLKIDQGSYPGEGGPRIDLHVEGALGDLKVKYLAAGERIPTIWKWF